MHTKEEMNRFLEEAKLKYPSGTKVSNHNLGYICDFVVASNSHRIVNREIVIFGESRGTYTIFRNGIWADITSVPKKSEIDFHFNL